MVETYTPRVLDLRLDLISLLLVINIYSGKKKRSQYYMYGMYILTITVIKYILEVKEYLGIEVPFEVLTIQILLIPPSK